MTQRFLELGFHVDVEHLRVAVEELLDVTLDERNSDFWGGRYWGTAVGAVPEVNVYENFLDEDGVLYVEGHPEIRSFLTSVDLDARQRRALAALNGADLDSFMPPS